MLLTVKLLIIDAWKKSIKEEDIEYLIEQINNSNNVPENFTIQYDSIFPNSRKSTMIAYHISLLKSLFKTKYDFSNNHICPCFNTSKIDSSIQAKFKGIENVNYKIGWALNNKVKPEKCFNYIYANSIYYKNGKKIVGINALSIEIFNKPVSQLRNDSLNRLINFVFGKSNRQ